MTETPPAPTLRQARQEAGLSIRDFEKATGINRGRLSQYERGMQVRTEDQALIDRALRLAIIEKGQKNRS